MDEKPERKPMGQVIRSTRRGSGDHLGEMVRGTVEEALDATRCAARRATHAQDARPGGRGYGRAATPREKQCRLMTREPSQGGGAMHCGLRAKAPTL
jgi:hypothetical protein